MLGIGKHRRCRKAGELLSPYLDDEIAPKDRRRLSRHIAECSSCRRLLTNLTRTVDGLRRVGTRPT